ncbi:unnamed protein product [Microthlaspi erraticum]|uniref:RNase H type-1 domain-containing protein n=1 Tax=Microthlaspi erraticum TaxID=1685480 RepID=A0A6D2L0P6_9BRAS|nr:unnamed protein product [Microthlaspi erraticum]CAA7059186.1 unnamed protein product [Microthlaspi erraticum]
MLKCNIGCSWHPGSLNSGASWLVRDHSGMVLFHSRRSYAMVTSPLEAELRSFYWAIESLRNMHFRVIAFGSPLLHARKALMEPHLFPQHRPLIDEIFTLLQSFALWSLFHTSYPSNRAANAIANSVFEFNKHQSYIARHGPLWLHNIIADDAVRSDRFDMPGFSLIV